MENNQKIVCNGVSSLYVLYKTARPQSTTYDRIESAQKESDVLKFRKTISFSLVLQACSPELPTSKKKKKTRKMFSAF